MRKKIIEWLFDMICVVLGADTPNARGLLAFVVYFGMIGTTVLILLGIFIWGLYELFKH